MAPFLIFAAVVLGTGFGLVAWQPPVLWQRLSGWSASTTVIASDPSGVYSQGYLDGSFEKSNGILFLDKYSSNGGTVWTRGIGDTNDTVFNAISVGLQGIYLSGSNVTGTQRAILLKYDLSGNKIWERDFRVYNLLEGSAEAVSASPTGVYVTGTSGPLTNQTYTGGVSWVRNYDSAGNVAWTTEYSNDTTTFNGVYASTVGVYVAYYAVNQTQNLGSFLLRFDTNGGLVWSHQIGTGVVNGMTGDSTGIYLSEAPSGSSASIAKYDLSGNKIWVTSIDSPDFTPIGADTSLSLDSSGAYISFATAVNHEFVQKYDLNGHSVWSFQLQSPTHDESGNTAFRLSASSGVLYVAGSIRSSQSMLAVVESLSSSPSLVFFGINPPWSFMILGGLLAVSAISIITVRRLRRSRARPSRSGQGRRTLPTKD
jgi:hypothetical protein